MITMDMTLGQRHDEVSNVARRLKCMIAGGYVRDAILGAETGVVPKDIDVWVRHLGVKTRDQLKRDAIKILKRVGQELDENQLPNVDQYGDDLLVFKSKGPSNVEPVEVIFHRLGTPLAVMDYFDIDICKCFCTPTGDIRITMTAEESYRTGKTLVRRVDDHFVEHFNRVKVKYPKLKPIVDIARYPRAYRELFERGLIDAPREVVPPQGQNPDRDEIRFAPGEGVPGEVRWINWEELGAQQFQAAVQAQRNQVHNYQAVQPRLQPEAFQWVNVVHRV